MKEEKSLIFPLIFSQYNIFCTAKYLYSSSLISNPSLEPLIKSFAV